MSYQAGSACFDTLGGAAAAVAAVELGRVVPAGGAVYVVDAVGAADGSITYTLNDALGDLPPIAYVRAASFPDCALLTASDGLAIGWGIAAVWLLAFGLLFLRKAW